MGTKVAMKGESTKATSLVSKQENKKVMKPAIFAVLIVDLTMVGMLLRFTSPRYARGGLLR